MEQPLLDVVMIVKNEESALPRSLGRLNALRPLVNEVCVYDTGSTDATVHVAESFGARVERGYWDGDFSRARNAAAVMAHAKWLLVVDADEEVVADRLELAKTLNECLTENLTGYDALMITVRNLDHDPAKTITAPSVRFYRPGRCHYKGEIHETIHPLNKAHLFGRRILDHVVLINHHGYINHEELIDKGRRNENSAQLEIERLEQTSAAPEQVQNALLNRARSRELAQDFSGALEDYASVRRLQAKSRAREWAGIAQADLLLRLGAANEAAVIARELSLEGSSPDYVYWIRAQAARMQKRYADELTLLRQINVVVNPVGIQLPTAGVLHARTIAAARAGEHDEAIACAISAVARHGAVQDNAKWLLAIWGSSSLAVLCQLLTETGPDNIDVMVQEFQNLGSSGQELAQLLLTEKSRRNSSGSPFGGINIHQES